MVFPRGASEREQYFRPAKRAHFFSLCPIPPFPFSLSHARTPHTLEQKRNCARFLLLLSLPHTRNSDRSRCVFLSFLKKGFFCPRKIIWSKHCLTSRCHCWCRWFTPFHCRCSSYLGRWTRIEGRVSPNFYNHWSPAHFWPRGSIVRYGKDLYRSEGVANAAEPEDTGQARFYVSIS